MKNIKKCEFCDGTGYLKMIEIDDWQTETHFEDFCPLCEGKGYLCIIKGEKCSES